MNPRPRSHSLPADRSSRVSDGDEDARGSGGRPRAQSLAPMRSEDTRRRKMSQQLDGSVGTTRVDSGHKDFIGFPDPESNVFTAPVKLGPFSFRVMGEVQRGREGAFGKFAGNSPPPSVASSVPESGAEKPGKPKVQWGGPVKVGGALAEPLLMKLAQRAQKRAEARGQLSQRPAEGGGKPGKPKVQWGGPVKIGGALGEPLLMKLAQRAQKRAETRNQLSQPVQSKPKPPPPGTAKPTSSAPSGKSGSSGK